VTGLIYDALSSSGVLVSLHRQRGRPKCSAAGARATAAGNMLKATSAMYGCAVTNAPIAAICQLLLRSTQGSGGFLGNCKCAAHFQLEHQL
jgi:hypothetical protein